MQKLYCIISIFFVVFLSSCRFVNIVSACERGNGNVVQRSYRVGDFNKIVCNGSPNVIIQKGAVDSFTIETDENLFELKLFEVNNGVLNLGSETPICPTKLNIYITMRELSGVKLNGNANVEAKGDFNTAQVYFLINGAGDINVNSITANDMILEINGSGDIKVAGEVKSNLVKINGAGDVEAFDLKTAASKVEIVGSGNANVNVKERLVAKIVGSGDVNYIGNPPSVKTETIGVGKVKPKQ